jgi:heme/copper-type cytochrome/quinol oxidase subunit 2
MITSQALPIVVFFLSWIWWATFIISIVGWVMFQIPWCCRQNGGVQYGSATAAGVTALCHLGIGIYLLIVFSDKTWCEPFTFVSLKDYFPESDRCREEVWATIASVCAALWAGACGCLVYFVRSGRDAKWKKMHSGDSTNNIEEVELEAVGATTAAAAGPVVADAAVAVSEPVGNNKVDDF